MKPALTFSLHDAYHHPATAAGHYRSAGTPVIGLLGRSVPRELVTAAGGHPVRLSPLRLTGPGEPEPAELPGSIVGELGPATARVLATLLGGGLGWIDGLVIGRDGETYTKLFYALREFRRDGDYPRLPPFAFFDLLRLPSRTSARYNRAQARHLADTIGQWSGRSAGPREVAAAVEDSLATDETLRELTDRRTAYPPSVSGRDGLIFAGAAQVLDGPSFRASLRIELPRPASALADATGTTALRVLVTGSGQDDPWVYETLEHTGIVIVGDDHDWGYPGQVNQRLAADPVDYLVDKYHFDLASPARTGLAERTAHTIARASAAGAQAVLHIAADHDEAPGWEITALRAGLNLPLLNLRVAYGGRDPARLREAAAGLREAATRNEAVRS